MQDEVTISRAAPDERSAALDLTFSALLNQPARGEHVAGLLKNTADEHFWRGLWVAKRRTQLIGATWAHLQPGLAATLWPPRLLIDERGAVADRLLAAVLADLDARAIETVQALLAPDERAEADRLQAAGFRLLAELLYLMTSHTPDEYPRPESPLDFEPYHSADRARMATIVDRTYVGSLDCPGLNGIRSSSQLLDEYEAGGPDSTPHWLFVRFDGHDVGCLLLADHPALDQLELVYMAVVPEVRGRNFGSAIVRYAQWLAASSGRRHLLLAVDAANAPAVAMYEAAGMVVWDRRRAYLRSL